MTLRDSLKQSPERFPKNAFAWKVLGAIYRQTGRVPKAIDANMKVISLAPQDASAYSNMGITLKELGRLDEAVISCTKAIALQPDFAGATITWEVMLHEQRKLEQACFSYARALEINPNFSDAYANLGVCLKNTRFSAPSVQLYHPIQVVVRGKLRTPKDLAPAILSLLERDPYIQILLVDKSLGDIEELKYVVESLNKMPLLHDLMRLCPLTRSQV